jgi:hypothetical protein
VPVVLVGAVLLPDGEVSVEVVVAVEEGSSLVAVVAVVSNLVVEEVEVSVEVAVVDLN